MERRLVSGPDKNGIKITEVRSITFNNDLNKFLAELDSYLIIDCNGQNTINDIKQYPSFYNFFIVSDENFPLLSSFCLKQHLNNKNLLELWAVCRHRKTAQSIDKKYKNITMNSIKVVLDLLLNHNRNHIIWLGVSINRERKEEAVKLIDYYSDIGFINEFIKTPNEVSPTGIQMGSYYQTMILDNNSRNINKGQKQRNKSEFLWDCSCLFQEKVSFYISQKLVQILKNQYITEPKEYGFGFYINQKEERGGNIYKLSLVRESKNDVTYMSDNEQNEYEWSKNCTLPPSQVNVFSYMHTHPAACYDIGNKNNKFLEINPPSANDIGSLILNNYRFILVPSIEGLHFLKTTNIFNNNYKTLGPNEKNKEVESIKQKFVNDLQTILLRDIENGYFVRPNLDPIRLTRFITLYGETLTKLFPGVFIYKFFPWTDSHIYLYKNEIIT